MKNAFLFTGLFCLFFSVAIFAQNDIPHKELGLQLNLSEGIGNGTSNFVFKKAVKPDRYFRSRVSLWGSHSKSHELDFKYSKAFSRVAVGYEKRLPLIKNSQVLVGVEALFGNRWARLKEDGQTARSSQFSTGLGVPVGVIFPMCGNWSLTFEWQSELRYVWTTSAELEEANLLEEAEWSMNMAAGLHVGFSYQFSKLKGDIF